MPEKPLLILPQPKYIPPPKRDGWGNPLPKPTMDDKRKRTFDEKFKSAINYIQDISSGANPEMVLVIETIGKIQDLHEAVSKIKELEWLVEVDLDEMEIAENTYSEESEKQEAIKAGGRLYFVSSNVEGLKKIHSLYKRKDTLPRGYAKWRDLFEYLNDVRYWNEKDRMIDTGILEYWEDEIERKRNSPDSNVAFEIELHFRASDSKAEEAESEISQLISQIQGQIENKVRIKDIAFHAIKVTCPASEVVKIMDSWEKKDVTMYAGIIKSNFVKYMLPIPQQISEDGEVLLCPEEIPLSDITENPPVIALLDGLPMINHNLLKDRLTIENLYDFSDYYEPDQMKHGTTMASFICHEDLLNPERKSLSKKIYAIPIMKPNEFNGREAIPSSEFSEDLVERAVKSMLDETVGIAPSVKIINWSICNIDRPFFREMSPLARLLDWLSWEYKVLFVVSAGNFSDNFEFSTDNEPIHKRIVKEMRQSIRNRKILSPAESMNAITVGAINSDYSTIPDNDSRIDVLEEKNLMAEYSRLGSGYRRSIKPEILVPGGRQMFAKEKNSENLSLKRDTRYSAPGQKSAYIGYSPEDVKNTAYSRGTSNAAALTTHTAGIIHEVIEELRANDKDIIPEEYDSLLIKSLLVHSASWNAMQESLSILKRDIDSRDFKRLTSQYLGYGEVNFPRVMECTTQRVTTLGFGKIAENEQHQFALPIPDICKGFNYQLIATLAYFTPINPTRFNYRVAKVFFKSPHTNANRQQADHNQVQRGTVQHEILNLRKFRSDEIEISVQCNADATDSLKEKIPYALSLTLETKEQMLINIYDEIREQIKVPRVRP